MVFQAIDTTATSAVASSFLSLYSGTTTSSAGAGKDTRPATLAPMPPSPADSALNNNTLKIDNANGNTGSKTARSVHFI